MSLVLVACGNADDPIKPTSNDTPFTFIKTGNEWQYEILKNSDTNNNVTLQWKIISENGGYYVINRKFMVF